MPKVKKELNDENEDFINNETEFTEPTEDTEKEIDIDDDEDFGNEGFFFELDEEISFTTRRLAEDEDEEDMSLDIAFTDDDPRDQY